MRNQIFTLMLSTLILTTNPLVAMEGGEEEGLGAFRVLPNEQILTVLENTTPLDIISASLVSKRMGVLSQDSKVWTAIATRCSRSIHLPLNTKNILLNYFFDLFKKTIEYKIPVEILDTFMKSSPQESKEYLISNRFWIRNRNFCLNYERGNYLAQSQEERCENVSFDLLDRNACVIFSPQGDNFFQTSFVLVETSNGKFTIEDTRDKPLFAQIEKMLSDKYKVFENVYQYTFTIKQ